MSISRNDPCHCGSGKKYKHCHLRKDDDEKIKPYEIQNDFKKYLTFKKCHAPDYMKSKCSSKIIKSHTVSKSSNLKQIAQDGHVYEFRKDFITWHTNKNDMVKPIGIANASTFFGFCSIHDKELFAPFEDKEFNFDYEQIFLLSYRALAREFYIKKSVLKLYSTKVIKEYDKGIKNPIEKKLFLEKANAFVKGTELGIRDLTKIKTKFDNDMYTKNFLDIKYYAIVINKIPEIMCSGAWIPEYDFQNNKLIDLEDSSKIFTGLYINTLSYLSNKGIIIFSWNEKEIIQENNDFIISLDNILDKDKPKAIIKWLFSNNENIYFSPIWWDNLNAKNQQLLKNRFSDVYDMNYKLSDYKDFDFVDWDIQEIKTNLELKK